MSDAALVIARAARAAARRPASPAAFRRRTWWSSTCCGGAPDIPVLFLDTVHHFAETYAYRDELAERWELNLVNLRAAEPSPGCGRQHRRVLRAAQGRTAVLGARGLRRVVYGSSPGAVAEPREPAHLEPFRLPSGRTIRKVSPVATWTTQDVWTYAKAARHPAAAAVRCRLHQHRLRTVHNASARSVGCAVGPMAGTEARMRHSHPAGVHRHGERRVADRPLAPDEMLRLILTSRVYDVAQETPLDPAPRLSRRLGNEVLLKREDLQPIFSFKIRGAYNRIAHLTADERARGVIAASAGNHAQGVAFAARHLGLHALIVMPQTTPEIKIDAVRAGRGGRARRRQLRRCAGPLPRAGRRARGCTFVHPFDDPLVIAGQGTVGDEILRHRLGDVSRDFVPVGGGGLIAGIGSYVKALRPTVRGDRR